MLVSSIGLLAFLASLAQAHFIEPASHMIRREELNHCINSEYHFQGSLEEWTLQSGFTEDSYSFGSEGLEMKITPPPEYVSSYSTLINPNDSLPYNQHVGNGFTFTAPSLMQYGKFSATVKSAGVDGAVTAIILLADDGDEIDWEILAGKSNTITSNFFLSGHLVYGVNSKTFDPPEGQPAASEEFYTYEIDWSPERIIWSINGNPVRTLTKDDVDLKRLPKSASKIQIGLWDGSKESGTAEWARGPINWGKQKEPISAYVKDVKIECDPKYNDVINLH